MEVGWGVGVDCALFSNCYRGGVEGEGCFITGEQSQ
jgi:hypothetical protein